MEKFGPADFQTQPWKNGGGTTLELLRAPHPVHPGKFAWRVSCATVSAAGPFSVFPGIDRTLMLLGGEGFAVRCGNSPEVVLAERGRMIHFRGDVTTFCRLLGGPSRDLNLMVDRDLFRGAMSLLRPGRAPLLLGPETLCLIFVLEGTITVSSPDSDQRMLLAGGELGRLAGPFPFRLEPISAEFLAVKIDLAPANETKP